MTAHDINSIAGQFHIDGNLLDAEPFGSGHINDTYILNCKTSGLPVRYILQRINHDIFKNPPEMMENIMRVTAHIRSRDAENAQRMLTVINTDDATGCYKDPGGNYWRMYNFIEAAVTYDVLDSPKLAYEAARMFGWFQRMLTDLPGAELHETIPDFHNTPKRFEAFKQALEADVCGRAKDVKKEIDFALENAWICDVLLNFVEKGEIPIRVTHNDTKINNVMLDEKTGKGICVIDLDTVMPGLSLYDFGDMVRTATSPTEEDETDLSKIVMQMNLFEQLVKGFAEETHEFLADAEKKHLVFAGKLITFEQYIRFLGDHLAGDVYYKIHRADHNLDRSRTQMKLIQSIVEQQDEMNELAASVWADLAGP